jgi:hypothetical protein
LGIPVFAVLGITLDELLARRFASFRTIYLPTDGELREPGSGRPSPQYGKRAYGERRAEMDRVDITADLNDEDQTGLFTCGCYPAWWMTTPPWSTGRWPASPSRGAMGSADFVQARLF